MYIAGTAAAALLLGFATTNLFVVAVTLTFWAGTAYCYLAVESRVREIQAQWRENSRPKGRKQETLGAEIETALYALLGLIFFFFGVAVLSTSFSAGRVAAIVFGPLLLGTAWILLLRYQRLHRVWVQRAAEHPEWGLACEPHPRAVFVNSALILGLASLGVAILAIAL